MDFFVITKDNISSKGKIFREAAALNGVSHIVDVLRKISTTSVIMEENRFNLNIDSDIRRISNSAMIVENYYNGISVELDPMLINDTFFTSINDTKLLNEAFNSSEFISNNTQNSSKPEDLTELLKIAATSLVLGLMILITIIGNVFVIAAIILERNLQNVANYLVASLAVADLFVACLVMPLGAVYEISDGWILGPELCDIWTSCDVLCCTASILHLVAIAVDRYWAVTNIDYIHSRTSKRVFLMIFCVWTAALIVSLAPQFGWKDPDYLQRIEQQKCMVSQDIAYQVFATCCTFYVPLLVILILYWKIYQTARKRIHRRRAKPKCSDELGNNNQPDLAHKKKRRLRLRIGKFSDKKSNVGTTLSLVEGNSTNTVNTVEDTEFSSSNVDSKSRGGVEMNAHFNNMEEIPTSSLSQISTVSHLVTFSNLHQTSSNASMLKSASLQLQHFKTAFTDTDESIENITTRNTLHCIPKEAFTGTYNPHISTGSDDITCTNSMEVLKDSLLKEKLEQVQSFSVVTPTIPPKANITATSASNATTITSLSALSPQTPTSPYTVITENSECAAPINVQTTHLSSLPTQMTPIIKQKNQQLSSISNPMQKVTKRKETLEAKRERKAAKTLAIITGAFVICWLPFFAMALMLPLCDTCQISDGIASLFLWLGYFNSTLNPVIYTIFSPEFRQAFKRILFGGHRPVHYRSGKI